MPETINNANNIAEKSRNILGAYLLLPGESYQFIARSVAMHDWFEEAQALYRQKPDLDPEQVYQMWKPTFNNVYSRLFAFFFEPYRMALFPCGDLLMNQIKTAAPPEMVGSYFQTAKTISDIQASWWNASQSMMKMWGFAPPSNPPGGIDQMAPFNVMGQANGNTSPFLEPLRQFFSCFGENQLLFSKPMMEHTYKVVSVYPDMYAIGFKYETLFSETWDKSLKTFASVIKNYPEAAGDYKEFMKVYTAVFSREYENLFRTPEFIKAQNTLVEMCSDMIISLRKAITAQIQMNPALPFVLREEADSLEKMVHDQKRRLDSLERKIREQESALAAVEAHA